MSLTENDLLDIELRNKGNEDVRALLDLREAQADIWADAEDEIESLRQEVGRLEGECDEAKSQLDQIRRILGV